MSDVSNALNAAADLIEKEGWWRGKRDGESDNDYQALFHPTVECHCPVTALARINYTPHSTAVARAKIVLAEAINGSPIDDFNYTNIIADWNDQFDSGKPVIEALRSLAKNHE